MISQKHIKDSERKFVTYMNESGHFAQRIAGSGCGKYSCCDVISIIDNQVYLTEIKSTSADKLQITSKMQQQLQKMIDVAKQHPPLKAMLAIHWKRRGWEIKVLEKINNINLHYTR